MICSFYELYQKMNTDYSERTVFNWVAQDGETVCSRTYGQFCADIRRYVSYLKAQLGDLTGKHAAVLSRNRYEYFLAYYAGFLTKCVLVPLNYQKDLNEILEEIQQADVSAVIYDPDSLEWLPELPEKYAGMLLDIFGYKEYPESEIRDIADPEALAVIIYTSGTTGHSKGVMLSQKNLLTAFEQKSSIEAKFICNCLHLESYSLFLVLPMFHVAGIVALTYLCAGHSVNICEGMKFFYRDVALLPSVYTVLVPAMFTSVYQTIRNGHSEKLGTLRFFLTVGARADTEALSYLHDNGYYILQGYAMTESVACGTNNYSQDAKHILSVGKKEEAIHVKLDDGEICFKGDTVFMGYYNDPEATAEVFDEDGWFHTGDLGRVDEEGYYYLTGRKKNLIILSGGENVSPEELENKLLADKNITEVIVKKKNDHIAAEIYCEKEKQPEIRDFVAKLNRTLPTYKYIAELEFRDTPFERTSLGKIKR